MKRKNVKSSACFDIVCRIILVVLAFAALFPFLLLVMSSITDETILVQHCINF